jgi:ubiquinone/menaquinone biosynthesis C-methylase UbiE
MESKRFNPAKLAKLNNPERLKELPISFMAAQAKLNDPRVIVDLGAGTGLYSRAFAEMFTNCTIYALDVSSVMVEWMVEHVVPRYPRIKPLVMDDGIVPLENESVDFLLMVNLHHEIDDAEATVREAHRVMKKGAGIAISDWRKEEMEIGPSMAIRVDEREVADDLKRRGFRDIRTFNQFRYNYLVIARR